MSVWAIPTLVSIVLLAGLLVFVLRRRPPAALFHSLVAAQIAGLCYAVGDLISSHLAPNPTADWLGLVLEYAGIMAVGPAWFLLALRFAAYHRAPFRFGRSRWVLLPAVAAFLLFIGFVTNPWHGQFVTPYLRGRSDYHLLWWIHSGLAYSLLFGAFLLHLTLARRASDRELRSQALIMAAATAGPTVGNAFYVFWPRPLPFDPGALGLCVACGLFIIGIYRRKLFALSPIALAEVLRRESDGVVLVDTGGRALYVNPAAGRLFPDPGRLRSGVEVFPVLARELRDPQAPGLPVAPADLAVALCDEQSQGRAQLYRFGEGAERWVRIEATPMPARHGRIAGHSLRMRDETALHDAVEAVADQAAVLEATLAATKEALLVTELDGTIRYFNNRMRELLKLPDWAGPGLHMDELRDPILAQLVDPSLADRQVEEMRSDPLGETVGELELRDGRILENASRPLLRSGVVGGRVWRLRDISEQRRSEAALRHAQKLESLGVMAGGIAHDFNNLLAIVMGNASLALEEVPKDTTASACLADVKKAAERAGDLTEQLLAYAGKGELAMEEIDVSQLVHDVAELIAVSIPKGVEVRYALAEKLPAVTGDASQLRQIVMNLIMNGAEAIGEEDGTVTVETGVETAPAAADGAASGADPHLGVVLRVSDSGCGMDEATRAQIFDPFFSTKFAGRGLGLAATLGIVRSHRGSLTVESKLGRGSTFTVRLPCREAPVRSTPAAAPSPSWRGQGTVLVVDDDEGVRAMASRVLRSAGLRVVDAPDGVEAVRIYRERGAAIDAVLLDVTMPHMGGERAWRALRELDPAVRVVLSSGYPEREVARPLADEAGLLFVHKPYEKRALVERIREALDA